MKKKMQVQRPLILTLPLNFRSLCWHFLSHIICSKVAGIIFCKSNPTFNALTRPKITCICSTASAQHSSTCKSTEQNTLFSWSDIQLSVHKTEQFVLWQRGWCHHTQARLGSWLQSLNRKFLTLSYRTQNLINLFSFFFFIFFSLKQWI